jgi:hypothetical protein
MIDSLNIADAGLLALVIALIQGLFEITKIMLSKFSGESSSLTSEERNIIKRIDSIICRMDNDGAPLVYYPRALNDTQDHIVASLRKITENIMRQTIILERMEKTWGS